MSKLTNLELVQAASYKYPSIKQLLANTSLKLFSEAGYEALSQLPDGGHDKFLSAMLLVSRQFITPVKYKDAVEDIGILERFGVGYGAYIQDNRIGDMPNEDPIAFGEDGTGLKNGYLMLKDRIVRKPTLAQDYYGKNKNYYNHFSWQMFDVKRAWLNEDGGLEELMSQAWAQILRNKAKTEYAWFFEALSGAINSVEHPLKDTQQIVLSSDVLTDEQAFTKEIVEAVKNVINSFDNVPDVTIFNADGFPTAIGSEDLVLLVRKELAPIFDNVLAYAFNEGRLSFPIPIKAVPNFGGLTAADANGNPLQPVYTDAIEYNGVSYGRGSIIGYVDAGVTVNGYAKYTNGQWLVNVTSGSTTADTTFIVGEPPKQIDPNADVVAVIAQKGVIFELVSEDMVVESDYIRGYRVTQTYVSQFNNGVNYRYTRNLITISKPQAQGGGEG